MIMGTTLFFAAAVAIMSLVVDILYAYVDPRIRYS
jgi:peptide/nickel transport system permease protein